MRDKITLIGMPWAGKTTTALALAKKLNYDFIDLDQEVEKAEGIGWIEIMNSKGADYFRAQGFEFLKNIQSNTKIVISPAGSVIYNQDSMEWIKENTLVVFLDTPFDVIEERSKLEPKAVANLSERGLQSIWEERIPMYQSYADVIINTQDKSVDQIVEEIIR